MCFLLPYRLRCHTWDFALCNACSRDRTQRDRFLEPPMHDRQSGHKPPPATKRREAEASELGGVAWLPPAVGSLALAVLHVERPSGAARGEAAAGSTRGAGGVARWFDAGYAAAGAARCLPGSEVKLCASPFAPLSPSVFFNTEARGCVAMCTADRALLVLDVRGLPGTEGGPVVVPKVGSGGEPAKEAEVPMALVAPPLRDRDGERIVLTAAVPLWTFAAALVATFPKAVLQALLGSTLHRALCTPVATLPIRAPVPMASPSLQLARVSAIDDDADIVRSLCVLSHHGGGGSFVALVLSGRGHLLVGSRFAAGRGGARFRCAVAPLGVQAQAKAQSYTVALLHRFEGLAGGACLLRLQPDTSNYELGCLPLPWCLPTRQWVQPQPTLGTGPAIVHDPCAFLNDAEVWALDLEASVPEPPGDDAGPARGPGAGAGSPLLWRGVVGRCVTGRGAWSPVLLRGRFPRQGALPGRCTALICRGPPASLLGLGLQGAGASLEVDEAAGGAWPSAGILPAGGLALASPQLAPLLRLLRGVSEEGSEAAPGPWAGESSATDQVVQLDHTWQALFRQGSERLVWALEAGRIFQEAGGPGGAARTGRSAL